MTGRIRWQQLRPSEVDLRDSIAKDVVLALLQGVISRTPSDSPIAIGEQELVTAAYGLADAMMVERLK